jgi:PIN domain nuclease of toxin-antitoxin system
MTFLIDTQILIWFQLNDAKLKKSIVEILGDFENTIYVSQVSLLEIAVKQSIGKLPELTKSIQLLTNLIQSDGFEILTIKNDHISTYHKVPLFENHRDPFDRLLIATALSENINLISADEKFKFYSALVNLIS